MGIVLIQDEILSPEELADRLKVSVGWVREQSRGSTRCRLNDPLPFIKLGKYLRFNWREVCEWQTRQENGGRQCATRKATSRNHMEHGSGHGTKTGSETTAQSNESKPHVN
jgi:hypothetical protein